MAAPSSSWPNSVAQFSPVQDFTGPNSTILAATMNAVFAEIAALESGLGPSPFAGLTYTSLNQALIDLSTNKSPITHFHKHADLRGDALGDDHPQYIRVDGTRPAQAPITAPPAVALNQLVTLGQVVGTYSTVEGAFDMIQFATSDLVGGARSGDSPLFGSIPPFNNWAMAAGTVLTTTNSSGLASANFSLVFPNAVIGLGVSNITTSEILIALIAVSLTGATFLFSLDGVLQRNRVVNFTYIAFGC